jgi:hypothetical protein
MIAVTDWATVLSGGGGRGGGGGGGISSLGNAWIGHLHPDLLPNLKAWVPDHGGPGLPPPTSRRLFCEPNKQKILICND